MRRVALVPGMVNMQPPAMVHFREYDYSPKADNYDSGAHGDPPAGGHSRAARRPEGPRSSINVICHGGNERRGGIKTTGRSFNTVQQNAAAARNQYVRTTFFFGGYAPKPPWLALRAR